LSKDNGDDDGDAPPVGFQLNEGAIDGTLKTSALKLH
jgi:hypothetical protein